MSPVQSARDEILARVRLGLRDVSPGEAAAWDPSNDHDAAAAYARETDIAAADATALFAERCGSYRASVIACDDSDAAIARVVGEICGRNEVRSLALPADLPESWVPDDVARLRDDPPLALEVLDGADGVLTGCAGAIANTGTIILDSGWAQGRRVLTLVPDLHICVVRAAQIHGAVPEAVRAIGLTVAAARSPITLISGPSATSDIELSRVEGVHGPRRLEVVLAG